jgi:hypothetical protein
MSLGNASVFSALTLDGSSPGGSSSASLPLTSGSNVASFSSIQLTNGQSATFTLSGTVTDTPPTGINSFGRRQVDSFRLASLYHPGPGGGLSMLLVGALTLALLAAAGKLRRRHWVMFAVWAVMAAAVAGCGNGGSASSDQQVTTVAATSSSGGTVSVTGTPVDMGTITLELNQTTGGTVPSATPSP